MDDLDWFYVRPNARQPLHVKVQRLRLGRKVHETYPFKSLNEGYFALWLPTGCGGRLIVEMPAGQSGALSLWRDTTPLGATHGSRIEYRVPVGSMGRIDVHVSPRDRPLRAAFTSEAWPEDSGTPIIPWNFWYFPYSVSDAVDETRNWSSWHVQMRAMDKFDKALPQAPGVPKALDWESKAHSHRGLPGWAGHCDPSAFASYYFEQPVAKTIGGQPFDRDELELLAAEWTGRHMNTDGRGWSLDLDGGGPAMQAAGGPLTKATYLLRPGEPVESELLAARYTQILGKEPEPDTGKERVTKQEKLDIERAARELTSKRDGVMAAFGQAAGTLWGFLDFRMLRERNPMVGDFGAAGANRSCAEVWNHAVVKVHVTFVERDADKPESRGSSPLHVDVQVAIATNCDVEPLHKRETLPRTSDLPPARWDGARLNLTPGGHELWEQSLDLDFNVDGDCRAARWAGSTVVSHNNVPAWAPRTFGIPGKPRLQPRQ